ncbi:MAG: endonuclease/exonuclease/phosphatase family protein [Acidobacteria bacterium]|nr:endonuclease/exonuclease/phosphatase family protein [Acidobacteriota bacterium]
MLVVFTGLVFYRPHSIPFFLFIGVTAICAGYQLFCILPYTQIYPVQVKEAGSEISDRTLSIIASNVLIENKDPTALLKLIGEIKPDLVLLAETDQNWMDQIETLKRDYPHFIGHPLDNAFGIAFFSRLELIDPEIRFLIEEDIPSVHTKIKLRSGRMIRFYGLHPRPPVPHETDDSTERDAELIIAAKDVKKQKLPAIVAGDLNDAAWSGTTALFQKTSGMLDPRIGRGFYNSFHAKYFFLRVPLDHFFHTSDFRLVELRRERYIGSDHFPMYISLSLESSADDKQHEPKADQEDKKMANEMIDQAK